MANVYIATPEPRLLGKIADELMGEGIASNRMRVYSAHPGEAPELPVRLIRYRSPSGALAVGALAGSLVGLLIGAGLMAFAGLGLVPAVVSIAAGAVVGALLRRLAGRRLAGGEIDHLCESVQAGQIVMVVEVDKPQIGEIERKVKALHPEAAVLGTDPKGTPPFP